MNGVRAWLLAVLAVILSASTTVAAPWIPAAPLPPGAPAARYAHAQCDARSFYVIAGLDTNGVPTNETWRYDAETDTWTRLAPTLFSRAGGSAVCYEGKIYLVTGDGHVEFSIYDVATNSWSAGPALWMAISGAAIGAWNGRIFVVGGTGDGNPAHVSGYVEVYDRASNTWLSGQLMPTAAAFPGYAQIGRYLYIVGGWANTSPSQNVSTTQRYDMQTDTWLNGPPFTSARADMALVATTRAIYAIGGDATGGTFFDPSVEVDRLDITGYPAGAWTTTTPLGAPTMAHKGGCTSVAFPRAGEVWLTGGTRFDGTSPSRANQYLSAERCPLTPDILPAALAADIGGNGILEPNEPATVIAPSWRNFGAVATSRLTGTATGFNGPAGPTYVTNDGSATYRPPPDGTSSSCLSTGNCYAFTVGTSTRPASHWDAEFTETLAPIAASKVWKLHVGASFTDVPPTSAFYPFVEAILHKGVTGGCSATDFCPTAFVTRQQLAVLLLVAKTPGGFNLRECVPGTERFLDVPASNPYCKWIEELDRRRAAVTCGTSGNAYCPFTFVQRSLMAVSLLLTIDAGMVPPPCSTPMFADIPASHPYCPWVEELVRRGIASGCSPTHFCDTAVTREQLAVFLTVAFGLTLYGV